MLRTTVLATLIVLGLCACGKDSNPLEGLEFKRADLVGNWSGSSGAVTLQWYKMEQDTIMVRHYIDYDRLDWTLQIDSGSYKLNVKAENPGLGSEVRETGLWLVSDENPDRIRFARSYSLLYSRYDTIINSRPSKITTITDLEHPYWDCSAVVAGNDLRLTGIDTAFLEIPVDSVTLSRD